MNKIEEDYVGLVRIRNKLFKLFVWAFAISTIFYLFVDISEPSVHFGDKVFLHAKWKYKLGDTLFKRLGLFQTLFVAQFFVISHIGDLLMLGLTTLSKSKTRNEGASQVIAQFEKEGVDQEIIDKVINSVNDEGITIKRNTKDIGTKDKD